MLRHGGRVVAGLGHGVRALMQPNQNCQTGTTQNARGDVLRAGVRPLREEDGGGVAPPVPRGENLTVRPASDGYGGDAITAPRPLTATKDVLDNVRPGSPVNSGRQTHRLP